MDSSPVTLEQDSEPRWRFTLPLGVVLAIGTTIRLALIDQVMRNDEVVTATRFAVDLGTAISDYSAPNNHILHSILVNLTTSVWGLEKWAIRLPALLFGLALIVAVDWWIYSATRDRGAALLASSLVAGSSIMIEYSTTARGYTMVFVGAVVLFEISRRLLRRPTFRLWLAWILVSVAGLATVPVFAFPLSMVGVWLLLNALTGRAPQRGRLIAQLVASSVLVAALTVLAYAPAAMASGVDAIVANPFVLPLTWEELPRELYRVVAKLAGIVGRDGFFAVLYTVFFAVAVILNRRLFGRPLTPAVGLLGPIVLAIGMMVAPPQRIWLFALPIALGMAAAAMALVIGLLASRPSTRSRAIIAIATSLLVVMGSSTLASGDVTSSREGGAFHDAELAASLFHGVLTDEDRIAVESHPRVVLDFYLSPRRRNDPAIHRDFENARRVFVVVYHPRPQDLQGVLDTAGVPVEEFSQPTLRWRLPETDIYVMRRLGDAAQTGRAPMLTGTASLLSLAW